MPDVWIVGATGGIGRFCKEYLSHHRMLTNYCDVARAHMIREGLGSYKPEMLVYAAGINHLAWSRDLNPLDMMAVYDVNVVGVLRCLQAAPTLKRVVVIGSDAAVRPMRTSVAYNASKAALEAMVKCIARERAEEGFVINIVAPGLIEGTEMTMDVYRQTAELRPDLDLEQYMVSGIPAGRAGNAREIARVVKWLVDDAPDYLNGSVITVNGAR